MILSVHRKASIIALVFWCVRVRHKLKGGGFWVSGTMFFADSLVATYGESLSREVLCS